MKCKNCGKEIDDEVCGGFCQYCGAPFDFKGKPYKLIECDNCGKLVPDADFCENCGQAMGKPGPQKKNRLWLIITIALLLLGGSLWAYFSFDKTPASENTGAGTANGREPNASSEGGLSQGSDGQPVSGTSKDSQKKFDELCEEFDYRMKEEMTFENAYELIEKDYQTLQEILAMLDENSNLKASPRNQYIDRFKERATQAIIIINNAVFSPSFSALENSDELRSRYISERNRIQQMRDDL